MLSATSDIRARLATISILMLSGAVACSGTGATIEVTAPAGDSPEAVRTFLQSIVEQRGAPPSISVAVAVGGRIVAAEAVGLADLSSETPATSRTPYRSYSISKAMTAIAVLQLVDQGKLHLGDDIRTSVPGFPGKRWPVTIGQLLSHTSGIRHYKKNAGEISSKTEYASLAESLVVFKDDPLEFEPGTAYRYTTFGFNLLTGAVEHASGLAFGDYLQRNVFEPAGMETSRLAVQGRDDSTGATGYQPNNRRAKNLPNVSGRYGSSGVVTTPTDLVRLCAALDKGTLLVADAREKMFSVASPQLSEQQALGWSVTRDEKDRRLVYASGGGIGFTSLLFHYPDDGVTGALMVNQAEFGERVELLEALLGVYLDRGTD